MTIQDIFDRLRSIENTAGRLILDTGFSSDEGLGAGVCHLPDPCEDAFLRGYAERLLASLEDISSTLRYLRRPSHGEFTLMRLPNERYGYIDDAGALRSFTCGDCLEAKICDSCGSCRWISSSISHDGLDYFLIGASGTPLGGLTVRERW